MTYLLGFVFSRDLLIPKNEKMSFSTNAPIFLCLPDLVRGTPIFLEILDFKAEIPRNRFQEKPPRFIY